MEIEGEGWVIVVLFCIMLMLLATTITSEIYETKIILSQETANEICLVITEEEGTIALDYDDGNNKGLIRRGELYCQIPSYDKTHLIKVGE